MAQNNILLISSSYAGQGEYLERYWDTLKRFYGDAVSDGTSGGRHVLFIPYANAYDPRAFAGDCVPYFEKQGIRMKSILDYDDPRAAVDDSQLAGIFMAGGNTFKLLTSLYDHELIEPIRQRVRNGLPYAGVSAGTVVACPGIYTTNDMPMVEPRSFTALGLVPFQINPHFVPGSLIANHHGETREERIAQFHAVNKLPVVAIREGCWLELHGPSIELGGDNPALLFEAGKKNAESLYPGALSASVRTRLIEAFI